jgi:predicted SAM-dependent methyltransferase
MNKLRWRAKRYFSRLGIGGGKRLGLEEYLLRGHYLNQLHLGCGNTHIPEWCNIDVIKTGSTDLVLDIRTLTGIPNNCADKIYSCHVLEHFAHEEIRGILNRWRDVLKPGGEIRISVPDLDAITNIYQNNMKHFNVPGNQPWIALIYGGQKDQYDFHKTGFNFCWLRYLLESSGFIDIERYPNNPHFIQGVIDNSLATEPFGEYISLNIMARKSK